MLTGEKISGEMQVRAAVRAVILQAGALPGALYRALTLALVFAVSAVALLFLSASALAATATGHKFLAQLIEAPPGTELSEPEAVAVDTEGNVFVVARNENGEPVVDVFSSSHAYLTQFGSGSLAGEEGLRLAVDSAGKVYVSDPETNTVDVFKPSEKRDPAKGYQLLSMWSGANTTAKEFTEPAGVAIDNSTSNPAAGDVYVISRGEPAVVDVFKPEPEGAKEAEEGKLVSTLKPKFEAPSAVAVNSITGQVYVAASGEHSAVVVFNDAGALETTRITGKGSPTKSFGESVPAVAVDETTGDVYAAAAENDAVDQFNAAGEWLGWLTVAEPGGKAEGLGGLLGVAVANSSGTSAGDVYVAAGVINIFGPNEPVPQVVTGKATKIERTSAVLNGTLDTGGTSAEYRYHFAYGEGGELNESTPTVEAPEGESSVKETVDGLKAGEAHDFRLVVERLSEHRAFYEGTGEFTTAPAVAGVSTGAVESLTPTSATLTGSLEPDGFATKYDFEYGETELYGSESPVPFGQSSSSEVVHAVTNLTGLKPDTTYHYRLVATNEFGTTRTEDAAFNTGGPGVTTESAEPIGQTTATLNATINPNKLATKYYFEYGETSASENKTPEGELVAGEAPEPVSAPLTALKLATTYHFRIVAENGAATFVGPEQEFTTVLIESESTKEVTGESATLQAQINPLGVKASYRFEYGETTASEHQTPEAAVVAPEGAFTGEWSSLTDYEKGDIVEEGGKYFTSLKGANTSHKPAELGEWWAKEGDVLSEEIVRGLRPETTYHYRVVVTVGGVAADGPELALRTPASGVGFTLPDGRGYEMVSPPNKEGAHIEPIDQVGGAIQAAEDGNAFAYFVDGPLVEGPEGNYSPLPEQALATRGEHEWEWSSQEIAAAHERAPGLRDGEPAEFEVFSPNLSLALVQPLPIALTPLAEPPLSPPLTAAERGHQEKTVYLREDAPIQPGATEATIYADAARNGEILAGEHGQALQPGYLPLVSPANVPPGTKFGGTPVLEEGVESRLTVNQVLAVEGSTPDLSHVVLFSTLPLAPQPPSAPGLYEWAENKLQLVSLMPCSPQPCQGAPAELREGGGRPALGFTKDRASDAARHGISTDGTRIIWTSAKEHLYLRDTTRQETVQLDKPANGLPEGDPGGAEFQVASADGTKVFFTDAQKLTEDSTATSGKPDLYECEIPKEGPLECKLSDLTVDAHAGESADVRGLVQGASEEGSYVYFVARGELAEGATSGANNLYVLHRTGATTTTTFIAALSNEDAPDGWDNELGYNKENVLLANLTARVSPNGQFLAFMSNRSLTGYDNIDVNEERGEHHADEEVFLYDTEGTQHLTCVSCDPTGARPRGVLDTELAGEGTGLLVDRPLTWDGLNVDHWLAGSIPGWTTLQQERAVYQSEYLSDAGRLFFTSADALVPQAVGDTRKETIFPGQTEPSSVGVENVYEYEPNGEGSCTRASGCVALISSGTSEHESAFLDATSTGSDVFFLTSSRLAPQDTDTAPDIYDAHVCGEDECLPPVPPPSSACGTTTECRGGSTPAPTFEVPPSFSGPGNTLHSVPTGGTLPTKVTKPPALTRAQKLALALKQCHKLPHKTRAQKKQRANCVAQAEQKYGAKKAAKKSAKKAKRGRGGK